MASANLSLLQEREAAIVTDVKLSRDFTIHLYFKNGVTSISSLLGFYEEQESRTRRALQTGGSSAVIVTFVDVFCVLM